MTIVVAEGMGGQGQLGIRDEGGGGEPLPLAAAATTVAWRLPLSISVFF